jgi:hypothetical protein
VNRPAEQRLHAHLSDEQYARQWIARIKAKCEIDAAGCWLWQGNKTSNGYGQTNYRGKNVIIHRRMYEITRRITLARWIYACHTCDVKLCCNPDHLWAGTPQQNSLDSARKGRHQEQRKTHCPRGHEYTPENTYRRPVTSSKAGARNCRECNRIRMRKRWRELRI